ncbi:plasmid mobilization protein [Iningainema tapete]|uniref:CopG family transcriptional regulator n=1 Tax=Iningainema tapete BLCC-T55 TaxID=2748662 RepID=A0A8J6XLP3_9CYAN|nr:ribbon-helix-helix protein, CopG family [Iningainema tapete]MBD2778659.1 CopG family transcriptional regulator [Iningainema tapete BLCC-T55]
MPKKGQKSIRGIGDLYNTPKKRFNIMLTEEARHLLDEKAKALGLSLSEYLEQLARGTLQPTQQ